MKINQNKWFQNLILINHYPNFAPKLCKAQSDAWTKSQCKITDHERKQLPVTPEDATVLDQTNVSEHGNRIIHGE